MNTKLYAGNLADTTSEGDLQVQDMMNDESKATQPQASTRPAWKEIVMKYQQPALGPSGVHHFPRLRARFIFSESESQ